MLVREKCVIDNDHFDEYYIKKIEWDLDTLMVGVMVLYYKGENKIPNKIKTHYFQTSEEVDVNELIKKVKLLHI